MLVFPVDDLARNKLRGSCRDMVMRLTILALLPALAVSGCSLPGTGSLDDSERGHSIDVVLPANAPGIKSDYGARYSVSGKCCREQPHDGIDIPTRRGHAVLAPADATVSYAGENFRLGKHLTLIHTLPNGSTLTTSYLHLDSIEVKARQKVYRGQKIAAVGRTGSTSAGVYHLHFSVSFGNPHFYWIGGRGIIECFDSKKTYQPAGDAIFTYPVACLQN